MHNVIDKLNVGYYLSGEGDILFKDEMIPSKVFANYLYEFIVIAT